MPKPTAPTRMELRAHLLASRIAGDVATPRDNNLRHYASMSTGDPHYQFGLRFAKEWSSAEVLALMVERCGVNADPEYREGPDTIDPDLTLNRLDAMGKRVGLAAQRQERVMLGTGHPVGLRPTHTALAAALRRAGCTVLTPAAGWEQVPEVSYPGEDGFLAYVDDVGILLDRTGIPHHTHSPMLMEAQLGELRAQGAAPPDLVVADHGWAGAAAEAGIDSVGFADCNDPALFAGEAEGKVLVAVPLDDNVAPHLYEPLTAYLLERAELGESASFSR